MMVNICFVALSNLFKASFLLLVGLKASVPATNINLPFLFSQLPLLLQSLWTSTLS